MSRSDRVALLLWALVANGGASAAPWNTLGRTATSAEIAAWDIDVRPDGKGLPQGHGSVAEGQAIYDAQCATCHGTFGESREFMALAGGIGSLATTSPQRTVGSKLNYATTLWDYINRAMPFNNPKSLSPNEVYAVTAYVLNLSDIVPADTVLDEKSLPQVKMPNRDGFTLAHGLGRVKGEPDARNAACMHDCEQEAVITSTLPPDFTQQMYGDISEHFRALSMMNQRGAPAAPAAPVAASARGQDLMKANGCGVCHGVDKGIVGPAFADVARRYAGVANAEATLAVKVKNGGSGIWGTAMMPPQSQVSDAALGAILSWILAGAQVE